MEQDPLQRATGEGFDQVVERLREVVERLEAGNLSLEDSLRVFEEGVRLSRRGAELLDTAEKRVEILLANDQGTRTVPFDPDGHGEASTEGPGTGRARTDG